MKSEIYTIKCANVQFRARRQVVELENRYITLAMNTDLKYSNQLPLENSYVLCVLVGIGW
jgi:hypothetical protein